MRAARHCAFRRSAYMCGRRPWSQQILLLHAPCQINKPRPFTQLLATLHTMIFACAPSLLDVHSPSLSILTKLALLPHFHIQISETVDATSHKVQEAFGGNKPEDKATHGMEEAGEWVPCSMHEQLIRCLVTIACMTDGQRH